MKLFKNEQQLIAEIHNQIDTAEERLLNEAFGIIARAGDLTKAKRLSALGFSQSEVVKKFPAVDIELAERIKGHKEKYPFRKFLTEAEFDRICTKYGLIYAPVSKYLKDVPEKNLREIETRKRLDYSDAMGLSYIAKISHLSGGTSEERRIARNGFAVSDRFGGASKHLKERFPDSSIRSKYDGISVSLSMLDKSGLFIAAPKEHFNLNGLASHGLGFFSVKVQKDPIVFEYCAGGISVITKWGLEASDEALINPINN